MTGRRLRVGTRGSALAIAQTRWVIDFLKHRRPDLDFEMVTIVTSGDKKMDLGISGWSGKGVFVKEIEDALLHNKIDLAVHSLKDLPTEIPKGLTIAAFSKREEDRDVLVLPKRNASFRSGADALDGIRLAGKVGTSSLRRAAQINWRRPDLSVIPIRGNLQTRLRKLREEGLDAIVVAAAGLNRLGIQSPTAYLLPYKISLPAVGQGVLAVEARKKDRDVLEIANLVHDPRTALEVEAERAFLVALEGGCRIPLAARAQAKGQKIQLRGMVASTKRFRQIHGGVEGPARHPKKIGMDLARNFIRAGARKFLEESRA